ncbi:PAS domain-containing GATA-type transcription factor [Sporobolomyces salmoneus]|uniref:PAS domain-containing GATA-type transcription factor n=1 Tax=Sporobolomyces salmoneus TaxID=183962 RepID=UPI00317F39F0
MSSYSTQQGMQYAAYSPPEVPGDSLKSSQRPSDAGPSKRMSTQGQLHRREPSQAGASAPYRKPEGASYNAKASSTTSLFSTRKNWSEHIIQEMQDFMHVLSPKGEFVYATPCIQQLAGWSSEDLFGRSIFEFIHPDDSEAVRREFTEASKTKEALSLYYRFKTQAGSYTLFEISGHWYYGSGTAVAEEGDTVKCFFAIARPYPSKSAAMLDSFLELKFENERLRQELLVMYKDIEGETAPSSAPFPPGIYRVESQDLDKSSIVDPVTGLVSTQTLIPSTSNTYGALGIGISANGVKGDGMAAERKKKKPKAEEGEFVCRDCGTVDSPEWRKGPDGPKSLCNACGLRYAKLVSKNKKAEAARNK